jgi:hypothetical protein
MPHTIRCLLATLAIAISAHAPALAQTPIPMLTDAELQCQRATYRSTADYLTAVFNARHDCFLRQLNETSPLPPEIDCRADIDTGTGDEQSDARMRAARAQLLADITTTCTGIDLENLGFPGFCDDEDGPPYSAFDHETCLRIESDKFVAQLIDFEQPPVITSLDSRDRICQDEISRKSSAMFVSEYDIRATCLFRILQEVLDPAEIDCQLEEDPLAPAVGDQGIDLSIVESHNKVLRGLPNSCPRIDFTPLGFPNICPNPEGDPYPLSALSECMFDSHHFAIYRLIDITNPLLSKCGNGDLDFAEQCDDGNNEWEIGEVCRFNCTVITNCGDVDDSGDITAIDALFILKAAIGAESCQLEVCDITGDGSITASDVLAALQASIGLEVEFNCPAPLLSCGNSLVDPPAESCDDGDREWTLGQICNASCQRLICGDPNDSGTVTVTDASYILQVVVGMRTCDPRVCDVNDDGRIATNDAQRVLRFAAGLPILLTCPF